MVSDILLGVSKPYCNSSVFIIAPTKLENISFHQFDFSDLGFFIAPVGGVETNTSPDVTYQTMKPSITSVCPAPRMPVTNEGLVRDSLPKMK